MNFWLKSRTLPQRVSKAQSRGATGSMVKPQLQTCRAGHAYGDEGEEDLCVVCMENQPAVAFKPCMHTVCCQQCAAMIASKANECPMCRVQIEAMYLPGSS